MNLKKSRHSTAQAEKLFAENIDGHSRVFPPGVQALLQFNLSKEQRDAIYRIRSAAAGQGRIVHCERLIEMLATWLLDDEQKTALAGNPLFKTAFL